MKLTIWVSQWGVEYKQQAVGDNKEENEVFEAGVPICPFDSLVVGHFWRYKWPPFFTFSHALFISFNLTFWVSVKDSLSCMNYLIVNS